MPIEGPVGISLDEDINGSIVIIPDTESVICLHVTSKSTFLTRSLGCDRFSISSLGEEVSANVFRRGAIGIILCLELAGMVTDLGW